MKILAIESSCDETAAAVVEDGRTILSSVIVSQIQEHRLYGGVVPEIASRRHCEAISQVTRNALDKASLSLENVDALAVTATPGLIGSLLVGVNYAKGLSYVTHKPLIPVHHLRGHIASNYLTHPNLKPPFLCFVLSGGHSHILHVKTYTNFQTLGKTLDDAAGEAYDKAARTLGYPYPGGVQIDRAAKKGDPSQYQLPRPTVQGRPEDFSFSGLKTAVLNHVHNAQQRGESINRENMAASFELAVCDMIADKLCKVLDKFPSLPVALAGGVSANDGIRQRVLDECSKKNRKLFLPRLDLCGDNAAMIGSQAFYEFQENNIASLSLNALATYPIENHFSNT